MPYCIKVNLDPVSINYKVLDHNRGAGNTYEPLWDMPLAEPLACLRVAPHHSRYGSVGAKALLRKGSTHSGGGIVTARITPPPSVRRRRGGLPVRRDYAFFNTTSAVKL